MARRPRRLDEIAADANIDEEQSARRIDWADTSADEAPFVTSVAVPA